jgi:hypothetical protein
LAAASSPAQTGKTKRKVKEKSKNILQKRRLIVKLHKDIQCAKQ